MYIRPRLIYKMMQDSPWDNVGCVRSAFIDGFFDNFDAPILLHLLETKSVISCFLQMYEMLGFLLGTYLHECIPHVL